VIDGKVSERIYGVVVERLKILKTLWYNKLKLLK
jgi:hypothetical protein